MNKCYKASLLLFSGALSLAGCDEQPEPAAKVEVSNAATPSATPAIAAPAPIVKPAPAAAQVSVASPAPVVVELPKPYEATLEEGIDFSKPGYPTFIAEAKGLSVYESPIRWSDANVNPTVIFVFKKELPKNFTLQIIATAFGPNIDAPVKVRVGNVEKTFTITNKEPNSYKLSFKTDGKSNKIEITPPKPTSPHDLDPNNPGVRKKGIAFETIKIKV